MDEDINVITVYNANKKTVLPHSLQWRGRRYTITKLGYYHATRRGRSIIHRYHVSTDSLDFALECSGDTLHWKLKEVLDVSTL